MIKKVNTTENQFTIPSMWYYDKNFLDQEKKEIFLKEWQLIGSHSQVKNTGDVLVAEIANNPIIVSRQEDNTLKGFYNVCQHRGGPLVYENCSLSKLQCKYHGWVYDLNGNLKSARGFKNSELNIDDYNLTPVNVTEWMGQIFVNLSNDPADLCNQIDEIKTLISPSFSRMAISFCPKLLIICAMDFMSFPKRGPSFLKSGFICFTKIPEPSSINSISLTFTSDLIRSETARISSR